MTVIWPNGSRTTPPTVTSEFGWRVHPVTGVRKLHEGIDMVGWSTILAPVDGIVTFAGYNGGAGNEVRIKAANGDVFRFMHNRELWVNAGSRVNQGQGIAVMGTTGSSTGVHCHEETRPGGGDAINPRTYYANANAGSSGGGSNPAPADPTEEEEEEMSNSGYYFTENNAVIYLIVNWSESTWHQYSNGPGNGHMPSAYNNAFATATKTGNFAPITAGHAAVIKAQNSARPGQETVILDWNDVEFAKFLAAIEADNVAASQADADKFVKA